MRQLLTASKQQLLKQQLEHTFIPNTSPKHETATSTLKHELLYYLSTSSIQSYAQPPLQFFVDPSLLLVYYYIFLGDNIWEVSRKSAIWVKQMSMLSALCLAYVRLRK